VGQHADAAGAVRLVLRCEVPVTGSPNSEGNSVTRKPDARLT